MMTEDNHPFTMVVNNSETPLDILLNAISGRGDYRFPHDLSSVDDGLNDVLDEAERAATMAFTPKQDHIRQERVHAASHGWIGGDRSQGDQDEGFQGLLAASRMMMTSGGNQPQNNPNKRPRESSPSPRQDKIAKTLRSHVILCARRQKDFAASLNVSPTPMGWQNKAETAYSTIEVWHGSAAQKSYGKEKRLLNPPPTLRVRGPLLPVLTSATLSVVTSTDSSIPTSICSQTHIIPLVPGDPAGLSIPSPMPERQMGIRHKRQRKEDERQKLRAAASKSGFGSQLVFERNKMLAKERSVLSDGLTYNGLWIVEESGRGKQKIKNREYNLQLAIGQPGVEHQVPTSVTIAEGPGMEAPNDEAGNFDLKEQFSPQPDGGDGDADMDEATSTIVNHLHAATANQMDHSLEQQRQEVLNETIQNASMTSSKQMTTEPPIPWATFISSPLSIVTKPSKKTAKTRSLENCISQDSSFGLWVRVNGQTVRTKYMKLSMAGDTADPALTAKTGKWTPFYFQVVHRARRQQLPGAEDQVSRRLRQDDIADNGIITYGSIVILTDRQTGIRTEPMKIVKVDNNVVKGDLDDGNPVSELQRIGLVKVEDGNEYLEDGCRWYLGALGATIGAGEIQTSRKRGRKGENQISSQVTEEVADIANVPETLDSITGAESDVKSVRKSKKTSTDGRKTKRHALAIAAVAEDEDGSLKGSLSWLKASQPKMDTVSGEAQQVTDIVDDHMCWMIGSASSFSCTFFDALGGMEGIPSEAIGPVPRILADPAFYPESNTLDLTLCSRISEDARLTPTRETTGESGSVPALDVYLGPIGPLRLTIWRSTVDSRDTGTSHGASIRGMALPAEPVSESARDSGWRILSSFPRRVPHVILRIEMPNPEEIIKTMQECLSASMVVRQSSKGDDDEGQTFNPSAQPAETGSEAVGEFDPSPWMSGTEEDEVVIDSNDHMNDHGHRQQQHHQHLTPGELTIQEALRNAGESTHVHDLAQALHQSRTQFNLGFTSNLEAGSANEGLLSTTMPIESGADGHELFLDTEIIDPSLDNQSMVDGGVSIANEVTEGVGGGTGNDQPDSEMTLPVKLFAPEQSFTSTSTSGNHDLVPLPLVLVRKSDGMGFGTGRIVVAERLTVPAQDREGGGEHGAAQWGLRVVEG